MHVYFYLNSIDIWKQSKIDIFFLPALGTVWLAGHLRPVFARPVRQRRLESSHICEPSRLHLKFISFQRARCQPIMSSAQKRTGDSPKGVPCWDLTADL